MLSALKAQINSLVNERLIITSVQSAITVNAYKIFIELHKISYQNLTIFEWAMQNNLHLEIVACDTCFCQIYCKIHNEEINDM